MSDYDLTIIIINYNTGNLLYSCLDSIEQNIRKEIKYQTIVVDNNSKDYSWKAVKNSNCKLIKNKKNKGFCRANNQALKNINSEFILLLNPDTKITKGSIYQMIKYLKNNKQVGILGPRVLYPNGKIQHSAFLFPTIVSILINTFFLNKLFPNSRIFNQSNISYWNSKEIQSVDTVSGCCSLFRKKVYNDIGGLDKDLLFMDDVDFCKRAKNKNWEVHYFPKSTIYHYGGMSSKGNRYLPAYFGRVSKIKYFVKHHAQNKVILIKILFLIECTIRTPIELIWYLIYKNIESKTRLRAYFDTIKFILNLK